MIRDAARQYCQERLMPGSSRPTATSASTARSCARWASSACWARRCPRLRLRRRQLRLLRPDRARGRAGRQRLPLGHERAVEPGHAPDPRLRHRGPAPEVPAKPGQRRAGRLLRPDRAGPRLRPGGMKTRARKVDGGYRLSGSRCGSPTRRSPTSSWSGPRRRRQDPRLRPRARHGGPVDAEDRGQVLAARLDHRRDRDGRRLRARGKPAAPRARPQGALRLPQPGALRHRLGRAGRGRVLLARGARLHARAQAVRPAAGGQSADPEEARRHADRDHARACRAAAPRPPVRRARPRPRRSRWSSATTAARRSTSPASPATCTAATASSTNTTSSAT